MKGSTDYGEASERFLKEWNDAQKSVRRLAFVAELPRYEAEGVS